MAAAEHNSAQTVIGRGAHVRGRVTGDADLEIHGHVEGEVTVSGELTVETHGLVLANLSARRLIVRGAVRGDLVAEESILLEDGARVVGDVRAPRVSIGQGALVRGYVQTGAANGTSTARAVASAKTSAKTTASATAPAARPHAPPKTFAAPAQSARAHAPAAMPRGATLAGAAPSAAATTRRGPPSPVVPALKKGAKGALAKKKS